METPSDVREPEAYVAPGPYPDPERSWPPGALLMRHEVLRQWHQSGLRVDAELEALADRITSDEPELAAAGLLLGHVWSDAEDGVVKVAVAGAADERAAAELLAARYGEAVALRWLGPSPFWEVPHPFASWTAEGRRLRVFFAVDVNGQQPGHARVTEEDGARIAIALTRLDPVGAHHQMGGYRAHHADVELREPVGDRAVVDASVGVVRPSLAEVRRRAGRPNPAPRTPTDATDVLIEELHGLGVRAYNALKRAGVQTVDDLIGMSAEDVAALPGMNRRAYAEVVAELAATGRSLT
jgi:Bacterial RNA polymerase, alpha chain C terminal domain